MINIVVKGVLFAGGVLVAIDLEAVIFGSIFDIIGNNISKSIFPYLDNALGDSYFFKACAAEECIAAAAAKAINFLNIQTPLSTQI